MKKDVKKQIWIQIKGENIRVEKKKIKNLYLRISPDDGEIRISAPERMAIKHIENFGLQKRRGRHKKRHIKGNFWKYCLR